MFLLGFRIIIQKYEQHRVPKYFIYALFLITPVSYTHLDVYKRQPLCLKATVNTVINKGLKVLVTYPNNDDGSDAIIQQIEEYKEKTIWLKMASLGGKIDYA